ncbi:MAG: queuosine precursor transporter [Bacteroidia bacterium]
MLNNPKTRLLLILSAIFISSAITAELISSKVFILPLVFGSLDLGSYPAVVGILPWPVVFLTTDIINEFYGRKTVRFLSVLTCFMIAFAFVLVFLAMQFKTILPSPTDAEYAAVFGQSLWIIIGSIVAFLVSQLLDSTVFWWLKNKTGNRFIWLRSTGSTLISQLIDTFIVLYIGFVLPGKLPENASFLEIGFTNYLLKMLIALLLTPLIYLVHFIIEKYLGDSASHLQEEQARDESLNEEL